MSYRPFSARFGPRRRQLAWGLLLATAVVAVLASVLLAMAPAPQRQTAAPDRQAVITAAPAQLPLTDEQVAILATREEAAMGETQKEAPESAAQEDPLPTMSPPPLPAVGDQHEVLHSRPSAVHRR